MLWIWVAVALAGAVEIGVERHGVGRVKAAEGTVELPNWGGMKGECVEWEQGHGVIAR